MFKRFALVALCLASGCAVYVPRHRVYYAPPRPAVVVVPPRPVVYAPRPVVYGPPAVIVTPPHRW